MEYGNVVSNELLGGKNISKLPFRALAIEPNCHDELSVSPIEGGAMSVVERWKSENIYI